MEIEPKIPEFCEIKISWHTRLKIKSKISQKMIDLRKILIISMFF